MDGRNPVIFMEHPNYIILFLIHRLVTFNINNSKGTLIKIGGL